MVSWATRERIARLNLLARVGICLLAVDVSSAAAQARRDFSAPGARATGMAGAFVGVADDATAAATNPGGLSHLSTPEVYFEVKNKAISEAGSSDERRNTAPSFLSLALPVSSKVTLSFYRHEFARSSDTFRGPNPFPVVNVDAEGTSYMGALGLRLSDRVRVGVASGVDQERIRFEGNSAVDETTGMHFKVKAGTWLRPSDNVAIGVAATASTDSTNGDVSRIAAGASINPTSALLIAADIERLYSRPAQATRVRAGIELLAFDTSEQRLFIRSGYCLCENIVADLRPARLNGLTLTLADFGSGEQKQSGAFGFGWARGSKLQVDAAFATKRKEFSLSSAVRF